MNAPEGRFVVAALEGVPDSRIGQAHTTDDPSQAVGVPTDKVPAGVGVVPGDGVMVPPVELRLGPVKLFKAAA